MPLHEIIPFSSIKILRDDKYRIREFSKEPRSLGDRQYATPSGKPTVRIEVSGGWNAVLYSSDENNFWLLEIEGPDHGVCFYGPFDAKELNKEYFKD